MDLTSIVGKWISSCQYRKIPKNSTRVYLTREDMYRLIRMIQEEIKKDL